MLSRDNGLLAQRGGKLIDLRLYGEIAGVYDSALAPAPVQNGSAKALPDYGIESGAGLIGTRSWRHARLSLEYKGKFFQYARDSQLNGSDQFLDLAYSQFLRPHLTLDLKTIAGTTTLANGEFSYLPLTSADMFALPANELFDSRTNYAQSRVGVTWQKTPRLSFEADAEGFVVRRQYLALAGLNGYSARAGAAYRLTRHQTIGASYQQTHFDYQRVYGDAQLETAALDYSIALSRTLDLEVQMGGSRLNISGLNEVSIDPAIAAIVGQSIAIVTFARVLYVPLETVRLVQRFNHSSLILSYSSGISPGNGVYLTSRETGATAGFSYTGARRFTAALNAGYTQLATLGQTLPVYSNLQGGGGLTYRLAGDTYLELRYDYRHFQTHNQLYNLDSNRVSLGMAFSPGATPLAIW
ncbi:MAG TPA: hypothetical protein VMH05_00065 [Bryobacteraceae bacterium]|nr:hypothetical protein [Bryobacteraceae bacterium]